MAGTPASPVHSRSLHLVEHLFGKHEAVVDDQRTAGHQVRMQQRSAETVEIRQHAHRPIFGTEAHVADDVLGVHQDVVVRDHDPLHLAGGAGSPDDGRQVLAEIDFDRRQTLAGLQRRGRLGY